MQQTNGMGVVVGNAGLQVAVARTMQCLAGVQVGPSRLPARPASIPRVTYPHVMMH